MKRGQRSKSVKSTGGESPVKEAPIAAPQSKARFQLGEDWWAVLLAFLLILLARLGVLGATGIPIAF